MKDLGEMRILIVDDDVAVREEIDAIFQAQSQAQGTSAFASSGQEALALVAGSVDPFDCVLISLSIEGIDTVALVARIRAISGYEAIPIMMLAKESDRCHLGAAFSAGAWDYLGKPVDVSELEVRLHAGQIRRAEFRRLLGNSNPLAPGIQVASGVPPMGHDTGSVLDPDHVKNEGFGNCYASIVQNAPVRLGILTMIVDGFDQLVQQLSPNDVETYLVELASRLTLECEALQAIVSYQGDGVFMALSFAFDEIEEATLKSAVHRAATQADVKMTANSGQSAKLLVGKVVCRDLPKFVEPSHMVDLAMLQMFGQAPKRP